MGERRLILQHAWLEDGWQDDVALTIGPDGSIVKVETGAAETGAERLAGAALPGMANLHSHGFQHLMAGLTGLRVSTGDSFWSWRDAMYRMAARIDPEIYEDVLAFVFLSMLRSGFTACAEFHYLHHQVDGRPYDALSEMSQRVLAAAVRVGMPLTLLPVLYARSGFEDDDVDPKQRRFRTTPEQYLRLLEDLAPLVASTPNGRLGVAPHSLRAVSPETLDEVLQAVPADFPRHIHVAEQPAEVEACLARHGSRPVAFLLERCEIDHRWCLVHATHMDAEERQRAAATGAVAGLCPVTEADLGDGFFAAASWQSLGGAWGIGTDSNLRIGVAEELRLLEYGARLQSGRRNVLAPPGGHCGEHLYRSAAAGGAAAIGQNTGRIEAGLRADFVLLDPGHRALRHRPRDAWVDCFVFANDADMVLSTWVGGKVVYAREEPSEWQRMEEKFVAAVRQVLSS